MLYHKRLRDRFFRILVGCHSLRPLTSPYLELILRNYFIKIFYEFSYSRA
jgi:hypothetical protein